MIYISQKSPLLSKKIQNSAESGRKNLQPPRLALMSRQGARELSGRKEKREKTTFSLHKERGEPLETPEPTNREIINFRVFWQSNNAPSSF